MPSDCFMRPCRDASVFTSQPGARSAGLLSIIAPRFHEPVRAMIRPSPRPSGASVPAETTPEIANEDCCKGFCQTTSENREQIAEN